MATPTTTISPHCAGLPRCRDIRQKQSTSPGRFRAIRREVTATHYDGSAAAARRIVSWVSRSFPRISARVDSDHVLHLYRDDIDETLKPGCYVARDRARNEWVVLDEATFEAHYQALPAELPVFADGEVANE